jgi:hypothetical protein
MCTECKDPRIERPLVIEDVDDIKRFYGQVPPEIIDGVYGTLMDDNTITPITLAVLVEMVSRFIEGDNGSYERPTLPFSAMDLKTMQRVQTPEMAVCHSVFESLTLAQRNVQLLDAYLRSRGMNLVFFCDCGCGVEASDKNPYTEEYLRVNAFRAYYEAVGTEVVQVESFEDSEWTSRRLDMGPSEIAAYLRIARCLKGIPKRHAEIPAEVKHGLELLKGKFPCKCGNPSCTRKPVPA